MTHLSRDELQRWWEHGLPADRERIVGHLAECDECGRLYGEIVDSQPVEVTSGETLPSDVTARAYDAFRTSQATSRLWSPRMLVAYAAAAALVIAASIPAVRQAFFPSGGGGGAIRGSTLQALAPIGAVTPPVRFRWESPVDAPRYSVEVRDEQLSLVLTVATTSQAVELTAEQLAALQVGRAYTWQAVASTADGDEIMRSAAQPFSVSPPRP